LSFKLNLLDYKLKNIQKSIFACVIVSTQHRDKRVSFNLEEPIPIGISISRDNGVASFGIQHASYRDYQDGDFIGNISKGGSCNLETITFTPHGNGTHTECFGHIAKNEVAFVNQCVNDAFFHALLFSSAQKLEKETNYLDLSALFNLDLTFYNALILRSLPNDSNKKATDYSGKNAPAIHPEDMQKLVNAGIEHLLVDMPSVDPEWDGGALKAHHIFWNYPKDIRKNCSITEFVFVPNSIEDGHYVLKLNIAPFNSDAAPSKPVLYAIR
jgi:arylformamidase